MAEAVRWGLVGCGDVAENKGGPALCQAAGSRLVAVMSRSAERAAAFAARHGAARHYTRFDDLLADDAVDAVYVATPPHLHAAQTIACAGAGKHVLCEKPMALDLAECDAMIAAARAAGVQLMVAYYRRRWLAPMQVKSLVDAGRIGAVTRLRAQVSARLQPPPASRRPWRFDPAIAGGGFLWDVGSHRIDLMVHLVGCPTEVAAFVDTASFDIDVDDATALICRFPGGAQGLGLFHWNVRGGADELEVGGTEGTIRCDLGRGQVQLDAAAGREEWCLPPAGPTHLGLVQDLVEAVHEGRPNCLPGQEGRVTSAILEAAARSSREGRMVAPA